MLAFFSSFWSRACGACSMVLYAAAAAAAVGEIGSKDGAVRGTPSVFDSREPLLNR